MERHGEIDDLGWVVARAALVEDVYLHIRPWLGPVKQEQATAAIAAYETQPRVRGTSSRCIRGHEYDHLFRARRSEEALQRVRAHP